MNAIYNLSQIPKPCEFTLLKCFITKSWKSKSDDNVPRKEIMMAGAEM